MKSEVLLNLMILVLVAIFSSTQSSPDCDIVSPTALKEFRDSLSGSTLDPEDTAYKNASLMQNRRVTKLPGLIVYASDASDIQKTVLFASKHNVKLAIQSTGHSYVGRSTVEGGILLNLSELNRIDVKLNSVRSIHGEVTVETGNMWARVYEEVDKHDRVVVGGADGSVGMGGYTQGGGHSPIGRSLGLAVDSLLEVKLITADGSTVTTSTSGTTIKHTNGTVINSNDADLFWALRGGGGGTWGVVLSFTFKLHLPPNNGMVRVSATYPMYYYEEPILHSPGAPIMKKFTEYVKTLDNKWGGYILLNNVPLDDTMTYFGTLSCVLLHFGGWTQELQNQMEDLLDHLNGTTIHQDFKNYTSFWDYEGKTTPDKGGYRLYMYNVLLQNDSNFDGVVDLLVDHAKRVPLQITQGCTDVLIGGAMTDIPSSETAVGPGFRAATHSMSCYVAYGNAKDDAEAEKYGLQFGNELKKFGDGVYFNEPTEDIPDWKEEYWGMEKYSRLLEIKKKWDPEHLFWCHHCVGSDLIRKQYCSV
ncbi:hypothetical protein LOTGIDRAFT_174677, partial [Lottia gigantea]